SGAAPLSRKNRCPETQMARLRLAKLNAGCVAFIFHRNEMRIPSSASVTAPTSGPNSSTEANANASDTEHRVSIEGTFSDSMQLPMVRTAKSSHALGTGCCTRTATLWATTARTHKVTAATKM